jgi:uncharacterized Fe-S cluster-containing radical SAM superfamily enzyme
MRQSIKTKTKVDLLVPVVPGNLHPVEPSDCFGNEYLPTCGDCSVCADMELCSIIFADNVKRKKLTFEIEHGPMLDTADFANVDMSRIERLATKYEDEGEPMTYEEMQQIIQGEANIKDVESIIQYIKRELVNTKMSVKGGYIYVRR